MKYKFLAVAAAVPLLLAGCATGGSGSDGAANTEEASNYPDDCSSIELLLGLSAGGSSDLAFRILADSMKTDMGVDIQPLNVTGGGGISAINQLLSAPKDGCTLGYSSIPSHLQYLFPESPADYDKSDFEFAGAFGRARQVLAVSADSPYKTLDDLIKAGEEKGGLNSVADSPNGGDAVITAQFAEQTGLDIKQVVVGGGAEKVTTLLSGQVDFMSGALATVKAAVEAGQLRALAVWSEDRAPAMPDVPTGTEEGFDIIAESRYAVALASGTPEPIRQHLQDVIEKVTAESDYQEQNTELGIETEFLTGEEYSQIWDEMADTIKSVDLSILN